MPRRKPASGKQRKAQLQQKRAIIRGDIDPLPAKQDTHRKGKRAQVGQSTRNPAVAESVRRLQSSFVKLPSEFLEETKRLAATLPLPRPISSDAARWNESVSSQDPDDTDKREIEQLTCPKRPKWRYEMTKTEVEKNEEGLFKKWLDRSDEIVAEWCEPEIREPADDDEADLNEQIQEQMPKAPTSFERNLEVWRQLWRVTEISQILLILLDSRCPLLHYPPSLASYLSAPHFARKRTILVLTKVDISGPARADAWAHYLTTKYPGLRVVQVESYVEKHVGEGSGARRMYEPYLPSAFRQTLVDALKEAHTELLEPPERIRDAPDKFAAWKPPVRREIDWGALLDARWSSVVKANPNRDIPSIEHHQPADEQLDQLSEDYEDEADPDFLTVGLIGQPNVGKSSLLNALFGTQKVRASKTPGKTKHFQTLFWSSEVRLVDCPGLVMPSLAPMETQVLSGILPISRVSAVPLCVYHASLLLPLERLFALVHPSTAIAQADDKRTWREPRVRETNKEKALVWTAMDILTAFALKKGWLTAKAGRPDISRAGNMILRMLAEGKIRWAFWPPDTALSQLQSQQDSDTGIWIPHSVDEDNYFALVDDSSEDERIVKPSDSDESDDEDSETLDSSEETTFVAPTGSRFGSLMLANEESDEEDEEKSDPDNIPHDV